MGSRPVAMTKGDEKQACRSSQDRLDHPARNRGRRGNLDHIPGHYVGATPGPITGGARTGALRLRSITSWETQRCVGLGASQRRRVAPPGVVDPHLIFREPQQANDGKVNDSEGMGASGGSCDDEGPENLVRYHTRTGQCEQHDHRSPDRTYDVGAIDHARRRQGRRNSDHV